MPYSQTVSVLTGFLTGIFTGFAGHFCQLPVGSEANGASYIWSDILVDRLFDLSGKMLRMLAAAII